MIESVVTKRLGALPVAAEFLRRLDVAGIVDALCPPDPRAELTHGQVIEVLVANRLTAPAPLFRVGDWARSWAVEEVFGVEADLLGDDRLARALDAIAPHLDRLAGSVGAAAIAGFGIDVARIHWDMTSMSVHGAYPEAGQDEDYPMVKFGHPKDRRVDLKQVQAGIGVAADGGVPVFSRVLSGGAGEVSQVVGAIQALKALAGERRLLMVADSKLYSWGNIGALLAAEVDFIAPVPASKISDEFWAGLDLQQAAPVDYTAEREEHLPPEQRGHYRVLQDIQRIPGPRKRDPVLQVRRILVHSTGNAAGQRQARTKRLAKATAELEKVQRGASGRYYNTAEKLAARVGVIAKTRRVASCLRTEIGTDEEGRPTLAWHFDEQVLAVQAAADGWYALIASRPVEQATPAQVLLDYKGQGDAERRYGDFKGTLAVTPVFVQHNRRVAALVQVICLALLVFCLIERQVRQALERDGDGTMPGIYPGRRRVRPTGRMILHHLGELQLRIRGATDPPTIILSQVVQVDLLDLLGLDVRRPRWLQT
ncbi:IS1634 family transposase (plasmid) [Streptomyces sp. NBC_01591]|uniref:IS1634 family transposase n=1 Tax=Streptomyces sp. NBC_01591 TaxID=2975888 RepID=UPI002DDB6F66|nr:IS1634 family transposase [Streptomyces sp. NBC_01591]WSD73769.1 IS1634 family transposase [Streptomyces sp. NBC_01591]